MRAQVLQLANERATVRYPKLARYFLVSYNVGLGGREGKGRKEGYI